MPMPMVSSTDSFPAPPSEADLEQGKGQEAGLLTTVATAKPDAPQKLKATSSPQQDAADLGAFANASYRANCVRIEITDDSSAGNGTCSNKGSMRQACRECGTRAWTTCVGVAKVMRTHPRTLIVPLLVLSAVVVTGQLGVWAGAKLEMKELGMLATDVVRSAATETELIMQLWCAPAEAASSVIHEKPQVPLLVQDLESWVNPLLDSDSNLGGTSSSISILLLPWGIFSAGYPVSSIAPTLNLNTLTLEPLRNNSAQLAARVPQSAQVLGPMDSMWLPKAFNDVHLKVFLYSKNIWLPTSNPNETWGMDQRFTWPGAPHITLGNQTQHPWQGPNGASYAPKPQPDGSFLVYWGFVVLTIPLDSITNRLDALSDDTQHDVAFNYVLYRAGVPNADEVGLLAPADTVDGVHMILAETPGASPRATDARATCQRIITVDDQLVWTLCISPVKGYTPSWVVPARIAVVFAALVVAVLTFLLMTSHVSHRALVRAMLPPKAIQQLSLGQTYAEPFPMVTILFTDIVSYTALSSDLSPMALVQLLDRLYSGFDDLVDKHGLYKVETIGDAFMAVGGAPTCCSPQDAARRVAQMALDMVKLTESFKTDTGHKLQIRVGIHSGDVIAAVMGRKMPHWCLVGDAVNVSSRMESNSLPMQVHVSAVTAQLLSSCPQFCLKSRGYLDIKGKGPMPTFWLQATGATEAAAPCAKRLPTLRTSGSSAGW